MKLTDYPKAIADKKRQMLKQSQQVRGLADELAGAEAQIDKQVGEDADLRNEMMRKARRVELRQQGRYRQVKQKLDRAKDVLTGLEIEKVELRDRFTAAKLQLRERIAEAEVATA